MPETVFIVDVGNTSTTVALGRAGRIINIHRMPTVETSAKSVRSLVKYVLGSHRATGSIVSSVVPKVDKTWRSLLEAAIGSRPLMVNHRLKLSVAIDYPHPETVGGDRLANACGAVDRYGAPVIVADFGTALTFDVISKDCVYIGGVIAPGLPLMTDYLAERTALLPEIKLKGSHGKIGKSTVEAMRIGARLGYRGIVKELANHLLSLPGMRNATVCATGGFARWVLDDIDMPIRFSLDLTLYGLHVIYKMNMGTQ
ncbi:MAG: type III pantothenate kinase [Lentisphaerae bacterium]|nr:type III pantothenate kinase [Lentisphaerota bacterium]